MRAASNRLALRYAEAFYRSNRNWLNSDKVESIAQLGMELVHVRGVYTVLARSASEKVKEIFMQLIRKKAISDNIMPLVSLLIAERRIALIHEVFIAIRSVFNRHNNIKICTITSSDVISTDEQVAVLHRISRYTKAITKGTFRVNSQLIAGIRVQGEDFYWERSIQQMLREVRIALLRQE